jgi:hypothetical protein
MRNLILSLLALAAGIFPAAADDFLGARPLGMAGAHRAIVTSNDAIMLNPAGMSLFRHYSLELQYLLSPQMGSPEGPDQHVAHISVVDNQIQYFATGLAYTRVQRGDEKTGNRYDLAFSVPVTEGLFVGADIKYLDFERSPRADLSAVSVDAGLLLQTAVGLNFGVVGYNLTNTGDYLEHPISMAAAVMYSPFRTLELSFDWTVNFQKPRDPQQPIKDHQKGYGYAFGIEYLLLGMFTLRAGYLLDDFTPGDRRQYWSVGAGYVTTVFAFDFGYRGSIKDTSYDNQFGFGIRLFL